MEIRPIRTDKDHRAALAEIDAYWGAAENTEEGDRLDVLLALVEMYEAKRWPIDIDDSFDPIDVLGYAFYQLGRTLKRMNGANDPSARDALQHALAWTRAHPSAPGAAELADAVRRE